MGNFFAELRRRHIYRVGAGYVVVAWALTQVVDVVAQIYSPPAWIPQTIVAVLAIGFPVALAVAWMIEGKAHEAVASAVRSPATTVDWVLAGGLAVVIGIFGYQQLAPFTNAPIQQAGVDAARLAANSPNTAISVAVLPFANVSADPEQEFFSDGITDEISGALAKIPDLRVAARTSAFQFKGQNRDVQTIGRALGTTHLVEGSVRKAANRIRIGVQLVQVRDGAQIWSETYDRNLTDIFAIQEEVAQAVAASLGMRAGLVPGAALVSSRTEDSQAYEQFLKLRERYRGRTDLRSDRIAILIELRDLAAGNPNFAPAWGLLAQDYLDIPIIEIRMMGLRAEQIRGLLQDPLNNAEMAAREALRLDPQQVNAYAALGEVNQYRLNWSAAEDNFRLALAVDQNDPDALVRYGQMLQAVGHLRASLDSLEKARDLEPFVQGIRRDLGDALRLTGRIDAAVSTMESFGLQRNVYAVRAARTYAAAGHFKEAAEITVRGLPPNRYSGALPANEKRTYGSLLVPDAILVETKAPSIEEMAQLLRNAPMQVKDPAALPALPAQMNFIYLYVGAAERIMEASERALEAGTFSRSGLMSLWEPSAAPVRKTERFKTYVRNAGLVDYWRDRGWPDLCRPVGTDDFECN